MKAFREVLDRYEAVLRSAGASAALAKEHLEARRVAENQRDGYRADAVLWKERATMLEEALKKRGESIEKIEKVNVVRKALAATKK